MLRALQNQRRKSADAGFTLIELLIVIVILGILAAIVVFSVRGITDKGKVSACKADVETVTVAEEAYYAGNGTAAMPGGSYTTSVDTLVTKGLLHSNPGDVTVAINADGSFTATGAGC